VPLTASQLQDLTSSLDAYLVGAFKASGSPGMFASLTYRDEIVWSQGYGTTSLTEPAQPTLDTIFSIGSVTKLFTTLQAYQLAERGHVSLHDPLSKYESQFSIIDPFGPSIGPTVHQMLAQVSGFPRELPCNSLFCNVSLPDILNAVSQMQLIVPPYTRASYSNAAFALIGHILAQSVGTTWSQYQLDNIITPLGLNGTGTVYSADVLSKMAQGYLTPTQPATHYDLVLTAPAGQMYSTPRDLSRLMIELHSEYASTSRTLFKFGATVNQMLTPVLNVLGDARYSFGTPWENYLEPNTTYLVRRKGGNLNGFSAAVSLVPELRVGLVLNFNCQVDEFSVSERAWSLILPALVHTLMAAQPQPPLLPANASMYAGMYQLLGTSAQIPVILDADNRHLWLSAPGYIYLTIDQGNQGHVRFAQATKTCLDEAFEGLRDEQVVYDIRNGVVEGIYIPGELFYFVRVK
jgi:CubicO group peptidase (beta-lactamase class C family)